MVCRDWYNTKVPMAWESAGVLNKLQIKVEVMLRTPPQKVTQAVKEAWKKMGPLTIEKFIHVAELNGLKKPEFDEEKIEYRSFETKWGDLK